MTIENKYLKMNQDIEQKADGFIPTQPDYRSRCGNVAIWIKEDGLSIKVGGMNFRCFPPQVKIIKEKA